MATIFLPARANLDLIGQEITNASRVISDWAASTVSNAGVAYNIGDQVVFNNEIYIFTSQVLNSGNATFPTAAVAEVGQGGGIPVVKSFPSAPSVGDEIFLDVAVSITDGTNQRPRGLYTRVQPGSNPNTAFWEQLSPSNVGQLYNNARLNDVIFLQAAETDFNTTGNNFAVGLYRAGTSSAAQTWISLTSADGGIPVSTTFPNSPAVGDEFLLDAHISASDGTNNRPRGLYRYSQPGSQASSRLWEQISPAAVGALYNNARVGDVVYLLYAENDFNTAGNDLAPGLYRASATASASPHFTTWDSLSGEVNVSGTPVDNDIAVWTSADTIEGQTIDELGILQDSDIEQQVTANAVRIPSGQAVTDFVNDELTQDAAPSVQYWQVQGFPNYGVGGTNDEIIDFSDFRFDDRVVPQFNTSSRRVVQTVEFNIATGANAGQWSIALLDQAYIQVAKDGDVRLVALNWSSGGQVFVPLHCIAFDPRYPGAESIHIGSDDQGIFSFSLSSINGSQASVETNYQRPSLYADPTDLSVAALGLGITSISINYRTLTEGAVSRTFQTVVFGLANGELPYRTAVLGAQDSGSASEFLAFTFEANLNGETGNIMFPTTTERSTYENQRVIDDGAGGLTYANSRAAVRSIAWNPAGTTMVAVGDNIIHPSDPDSDLSIPGEGFPNQPLMAVSQNWGIRQDFIIDGVNTVQATFPTDLDGQDARLVYLGVDPFRDANYPISFKREFLEIAVQNDDLDRIVAINAYGGLLGTTAEQSVREFVDISFEHVFYHPGANGSYQGWVISGRRTTNVGDVEGFAGIMQDSHTVYDNGPYYHNPGGGSGGLIVINGRTGYGNIHDDPGRTYPVHKGVTRDQSTVVFLGDNSAATDFDLRTSITDQFGFVAPTYDNIVNGGGVRQPGYFNRSTDSFYGGYIPNTSGITETTVLHGNRSGDSFWATRVEQGRIDVHLTHPTLDTVTFSAIKNNADSLPTFLAALDTAFEALGDGDVAGVENYGTQAGRLTVSLVDEDNYRNVSVTSPDQRLIQYVADPRNVFYVPRVDSFIAAAAADEAGGAQRTYALSHNFTPAHNFNPILIAGGVTLVQGDNWQFNGVDDVFDTFTIANNVTLIPGVTEIVIVYIIPNNVMWTSGSIESTTVTVEDNYDQIGSTVAHVFNLNNTYHSATDNNHQLARDLGAYLANALNASNIVVGSTGDLILFEVTLTHGAILHEEDKINIIVDNPDVVGATQGDLRITRWNNGASDTPGSEGGKLDIDNLPTRDEILNVINHVLADAEGGAFGISQLPVVSTNPDGTELEETITQGTEGIILADDFLATKSYVDAHGVDISSGGTHDFQVAQDSGGNNVVVQAIQEHASLSRWFIQLNAHIATLPLPTVGSHIRLGRGTTPETAEFEVLEVDNTGVPSIIEFDGDNIPQAVLDLISTAGGLGNITVFIANLREDLGDQNRLIFNSDDFVVNTDDTDEKHVHISLSPATGNVITDLELASSSLWQAEYRNDYPASAVVFDNIAAAPGSRRDFTRTGTSINANVATDGVSKPGDNTYSLIDLPADNPLSAFNGLLVDANFEWVARYYVDIIWRDNTQYYEGDTVQYTGAFGFTRRVYCEFPHISTEANSPFVIGNVEYGYRTTSFNANTPWSPVESSVDIATGTTGEGIAPYFNNNSNTNTPNTLRNVRVWDSYLAHGEHAGQFAIVLGTGTTTVQPANINLGNQPSPGDRFHFSDGIFAPSNAPEYELVGIDLIHDDGIGATYNIDVEITADAEFNNAATTRAIATNGFGRLSAGDTALINVPGILNPVTFTVINVDEVDDTIDLQPNLGTEFTLPARVYTFEQDTSAFNGENYTTYFFELPDGVLRVPTDISINDYFSVSDTRTDLGHTNRFVFRDDQFVVTKEGVGESFIEIAPTFSGITVDRVNNGEYSVTVSEIAGNWRFSFSSGFDFRAFLAESGFPDDLQPQSYRLGHIAIVDIATTPASRFIISADAIYTYDTSAGSIFTVPTSDVTQSLPRDLDGNPITPSTDFGDFTFEIQEYQFNSVTAGDGIRFDHSLGEDNLTISYDGGDTGGFTNGQDVRLGGISTIGGTVSDDSDEVRILGNREETIDADWRFNGTTAVTNFVPVTNAMGQAQDTEVNTRFDFTTAPGGSGLFATIRNVVTGAISSGGTNVATGANNFAIQDGTGINSTTVTQGGVTTATINSSTVVSQGEITLPGQEHIVTSTGPETSIDTFITQASQARYKTSGDVDIPTGLVGLSGNNRPTLIVSGAVQGTNSLYLADASNPTSVWENVTTLNINDDQVSSTQPIRVMLESSLAGDHILIRVDNQNWALYQVTAPAGAAAGSVLTLDVAIVEPAVLNSAGVASASLADIVGSNRESYIPPVSGAFEIDARTALRYRDGNQHLLATAVYDLTTSGITTDGAGNVTAEKDINDSPAWTMSYLAVQFNSSDAIQITDANKGTTISVGNSNIAAIVAGQTLNFTANTYVAYASQWKGSIQVFVDVVDNDSGATVTHFDNLNPTVGRTFNPITGPQDKS